MSDYFFQCCVKVSVFSKHSILMMLMRPVLVRNSGLDFCFDDGAGL